MIVKCLRSPHPILHSQIRMIHLDYQAYSILVTKFLLNPLFKVQVHILMMVLVQLLKPLVGEVEDNRKDNCNMLPQNRDRTCQVCLYVKYDGYIKITHSCYWMIICTMYLISEMWLMYAQECVYCC